MITTFVGVASADITPSYPVMLGGFGQRITPSDSVHDAIETVALQLLTQMGHMAKGLNECVMQPAVFGWNQYQLLDESAQQLPL